MRAWRVPYPKFGDGPGLERVAAVARRLGVALADFGRTGAVIVGSNGKGSTAAIAAALLAQSGAPVGLFTSPHLFDLNERFRIGDDDITDDDLDRHWRRVETAIESAGLATKVGGFEFLFLIAADWFAARGCAHTVWEAGIGGGHDPVRLIAARRVALTSLDLEHTALLGSTLEDIAREKIDAAPAGARAFVSESCLPVREAIEAHAASHGVRAQFLTADDFGAFEAPMQGAFQRRNMALAIGVARDIVLLDDASVKCGLAATRWPGRLEVIDADPLTVIDVGHTPDGVQAALRGFEDMRAGSPGVLVCGASRDKDAGALIAALAPAFSTIVCASARHKGAPVTEIASYANAANPNAEIVLADSVTDARHLALARARDGRGGVRGGRAFPGSRVQGGPPRA